LLIHSNPSKAILESAFTIDLSKVETRELIQPLAVKVLEKVKASIENANCLQQLGTLLVVPFHYSIRG
jgi:hypothetical protein